MIALLWALAATAVVVVAVHVPFLLWKQVAVLDLHWRPKLREPTATRRLRLSYSVRRLWIVGAALGVVAFCVSWLVMAGILSGFLSWAAVAAGVRS